MIEFLPHISKSIFRDYCTHFLVHFYYYGLPKHYSHHCFQKKKLIIIVIIQKKKLKNNFTSNIYSYFHKAIQGLHP